MKKQKIVGLSLLIFVVCIGFVGCESSMSEDEYRRRGEFATYNGVGVVKSIGDGKYKKITIKHESIKNF